MAVLTAEGAEVRRAHVCIAFGLGHGFFNAEGAEVRRGRRGLVEDRLQIVNQTVDAVSEVHYVKVYQQPDPMVAQSQVRKQLRVMDKQQPGDGLYVYHHGIIYQ